MTGHFIGAGYATIRESGPLIRMVEGLVRLAGMHFLNRTDIPGLVLFLIVATFNREAPCQNKS